MTLPQLALSYLLDFQLVAGMDWDRDRDGKLTKAEFSSYVPPVMIGVPGLGGPVKRDSLFEALDKDKNGEITRSEAGQGWRLVRRMDANGDGKLTRAEEVEARTRLDKAVQERRARTFDELDKDGDGVLFFAELLGQRSDIRLQERPRRTPGGSKRRSADL